MKRRLMTLLAAIAALSMMAGPASARGNSNMDRYDEDGNGIPDAGVVVTDIYSYYDDNSGCDYTVQSRGDFGNDPYLDSGWIKNIIKCDDGSHYTYLFVHESDPRYDLDPDRAIWGDWEWHILTASGHGNIANPAHPKYYFGS